LVHSGSSEVTKFETRTLTGLVINHRNAGRLSQLPSSSRKAQLQTAKGTRTAPLSSRIPCHTCHEDGCAIQPNIPSSVHFPDVLRFFSAADQAQPTRLGYLAQRRSPSPTPFGYSSMTPVTEGAQGSGLNAKIAGSRKFAARRGLAATPFGRRSGRPDLVCAAQHPKFERCATNVAPFV
jgi:hypothetical protein